jgi:hypothetical protein
MRVLSDVLRIPHRADRIPRNSSFGPTVELTGGALRDGRSGVDR